MNYVIGIDGGGTKTQVMLADQHGNILTNEQYGSTNPNTVSKQYLRELFQQMFQDIQEKIPNSLEQVSSVFAGISGAGSADSAFYLRELIEGSFPNAPIVRVEPDALNALYSGTFGGPGIVQICGTGSITYGINQHQVQDRVGGWGYLLGDEGSGYDVGRKGIMAALQYEDGRGPKTILLDLLHEHFGAKTGRQLIDKVYQSESPKLTISPVSPLVFQAFEQGDQVAATILHQVADEIYHSLKTLADRLFSTEDSIPIILCGGLFQNSSILSDLLVEKCQRNFSFLLPDVPPVVGSLAGAIQGELTSDVITRLKYTSK
ncbi:N-acetylglucosamine kinase [Ornithinibacillus bavariensis]|uniref:N-acetylmuramic acid/N-acetylglucosamine kinase n=1 Tax=Ornithinibacillus bavariensis TaxID=545502 RepID=A0A919X688_9BACI|nr:ROK family protein [Ornithinibacillus bavariensis]GIO26509.1 N-acetylmuramic acid/N-acetylglucosamine kinase [Ornithinibacillus bavariensis]